MKFLYQLRDGTIWWIDETHPQTNDAIVCCRQYVLSNKKLGRTAMFPRSELKPTFWRTNLVKARRLITPGEWHSQVLSEGVIPTVYTMGRGGTTVTIARLDRTHPHAMVRANGRMIAAAPDLYRALIRLMEATPVQFHASDEWLEAIQAVHKAEEGE